jgi:hypothetical protein
MLEELDETKHKKEKYFPIIKDAVIVYIALVKSG